MIHNYRGNTNSKKTSNAMKTMYCSELDVHTHVSPAEYQLVRDMGVGESVCVQASNVGKKKHVLWRS